MYIVFIESNKKKLGDQIMQYLDLIKNNKKEMIDFYLSIDMGPEGGQNDITLALVNKEDEYKINEILEAEARYSEENNYKIQIYQIYDKLGEKK